MSIQRLTIKTEDLHNFFQLQQINSPVTTKHLPPHPFHFTVCCCISARNGVVKWARTYTRICTHAYKPNMHYLFLGSPRSLFRHQRIICQCHCSILRVCALYKVFHLCLLSWNWRMTIRILCFEITGNMASCGIWYVWSAMWVARWRGLYTLYVCLATHSHRLELQGQ